MGLAVAAAYVITLTRYEKFGGERQTSFYRLMVYFLSRLFGGEHNVSENDVG